MAIQLLHKEHAKWYLSQELPNNSYWVLRCHTKVGLKDCTLMAYFGSAVLDSGK